MQATPETLISLTRRLICEGCDDRPECGGNLDDMAVCLERSIPAIRRRMDWNRSE